MNDTRDPLPPDTSPDSLPPETPDEYDLSIALPDIQLNADGRIDEDIYCLSCGYNLRTLFPEAACPECGTAVGRSIMGDFLRYASPKWIKTLANGMIWIIASIVLSFLSICINMGLIRTAGLTATPGNNIHMAPLLISWGIGLVSLIGYWKVTTPEPSKIDEEKPVNARTLTRWCSVINFIMNPLQAANVLFPPIATIALTVASGIIGIVGFFAVFIYARSLALRVPDLSLARQTRIVMWGICGAMIGSVLLVILAAASGLAAGPTTGGTANAGMFVGIFTVLGCAGGVAFLVFGIWSLVLIVRYTRRFNEAAYQAEESWARTQTAEEIIQQSTN